MSHFDRLRRLILAIGATALLLRAVDALARWAGGAP